MTTPAEPTASGASEGRLRQGGRALLLALYTALRSLKLYPVENATVQKALDDLDDRRACAGGAGGRPRDPPGGRLHLRERHPPPARARQLRVVQPHPGDAAGLLGRRAPGARGGQPARVADLPEPAAEPVRAGRARRSASRSCSSAWPRRGVTGPRGRARRRARSTIPTREQAKEQAKRIYSQGVAVTKDVITGARLGRATSVKRVKRAVQLDRRPGPQQRDLAGGPHDDPRLRRVHVHPLGQRLHLLGGAGQEAGLHPAPALRPRHDGAAARRGQGAGPGGHPQQDHRARRAGVADHAGAPVARRAHPVRHARARRAAVPDDPRGARAPHEDRPDRVSQVRPRPRRSASSRASWRWPTASTPPPRGGATRRYRSSRTRCCARCGRTRKRGYDTRARQGAHQPDRHLSGGHLRHPRHVRGRPRGRAQSRGPAAQPSAWCGSRWTRMAARCRRRARW